jgi:hypothetical protein
MDTTNHGSQHPQHPTASNQPPLESFEMPTKKYIVLIFAATSVSVSVAWLLFDILWYLEEVAVVVAVS